MDLGCGSWDVATPLEHVVADVPHFLGSARGNQPDYTSASPSVARHWASEFTTNSGSELAAVVQELVGMVRLAVAESARFVEAARFDGVAVNVDFE